MNNPDLNEILNKEIGDLADLMKTAIKSIGDQYNLNVDQTSEIERDFIARLAFAAIKYGDQKESDKPEELPDYVIKALSFVKDYCLERDCDDCIFNGLDKCNIKYIPEKWEV